MGLASRIFYFFTPYTDAREQTVGRFFKGLNEHSNQSRTRLRLGKLIQRDIAVINLWTEYRYKGYKYLRKSQRRKLYANLQLIADDFDRFYIARKQSATTAGSKKAALMQSLMDYFSPKNGKYTYRQSSSFGRLLRDPSHQMLVGDCNQIVTLYIYLYSRYHDVRDLQLRLLPGHVALHFEGADIETTNGTFANYAKKSNALLPIEEIVSINLLDVTDSYLATHEVAAEDLLQASRLAFILSRDRDIVTHNLDAAYSRLVNALMDQDNYSRALKVAKASRSMILISLVGHNGTVYEMQQQNYTAARRFAKYAAKRDELTKNSWRAEGIHHYQAHRYYDAIKAFKHLNDQAAIKRCYEALFFEEQQKLGSNLTSDSIRKHGRTIKHMYAYAKKSGNKKLVKYASSLRKHL